MPATASPFMDQMFNKAAKVAWQNANGHFQSAVQIYFIMVDEIVGKAARAGVAQSKQESRKTEFKGAQSAKAGAKKIVAEDAKEIHDAKVILWEETMETIGALNAIGAAVATGSKIIGYGAEEGWFDNENTTVQDAAMEAAKAAEAEAGMDAGKVAELTKMRSSLMYENNPETGKMYTAQEANEIAHKSAGFGWDDEKGQARYPDAGYSEARNKAWYEDEFKGGVQPQVPVSEPALQSIYEAEDVAGRQDADAQRLQLIKDATPTGRAQGIPEQPDFETIPVPGGDPNIQPPQPGAPLASAGPANPSRKAMMTGEGKPAEQVQTERAMEGHLYAEAGKNQALNERTIRELFSNEEWDEMFANLFYGSSAGGNEYEIGALSGPGGPFGIA